MTEREEVRELRATIRELTGKVPVSYRIEHLRRRLADLLASRDVRELNRDAGRRVFVTIDLGVERHALCRAMSTGAISVVDVIKRAIDEHAVRNGHGARVERYKKARDS